MSIVNSEYSTKSRGSLHSVYQTNGKPLSAEALYKAKLKYGIFNSPSNTGLGVPDGANASDTAALLAASTDLKISAYKRTVAPDAQTAALFAKTNTAPEIWKRESVDYNAQSAAANAKSLKSIISNKSIDSTSHLPTSQSSSQRYNSIQSSSNAASAASKIRASTLTSSNLASLYEFDNVRTNGPKTNLNLAKISAVAKEKSEAQLNNRLNPEKDSSIFGLKTQSKQDPKTLEAFAAVGALASQGYTVPEDPDLEAKAIYRNSLIDPKVLAAASLNASKTLKGIDKYLGSKDLLLNPEFNKAALAIAQQRHEKRAQFPGNGKVDIGGGLYMTQAELDAIAAKFVNPVLESINKQAAAQRKKDYEIAKQKEENKKAQEQFKQEQKAKKLEEKRLKEEAKIQRRKEMDEEKNRQIQAKQQLEATKKEELTKTQQILASKQKEEKRKREELLAKQKEENERIAQETKAADDKRKAELKVVQQERDAKLAPILADLAQEQEKLALLESEKKAIQDITDSQIKNTENAQGLLDASKLELVQAEETLEQLKIDIENSQDESERLAKESELKKAEAEVVLKKTKEIELEANLKKAEIAKEQAAVENERLKLELELENEKISALEEEKKIIEILPPAPEPEVEEEPEVPEVPATEEVLKPVEAPTTSTTTTTSAATTEKKATSAPAALAPIAPINKSYTPPTPSKPELNEHGRYRSLVDEALYFKPNGSSIPQKATPTKKSEEEVDGGELKQTFSGFSQGSNDEKAVNDETSKSTTVEVTPDSTKGEGKSYFKEEF